MKKRKLCFLIPLILLTGCLGRIDNVPTYFPCEESVVLPDDSLISRIEESFSVVREIMPERLDVSFHLLSQQYVFPPLSLLQEAEKEKHINAKAAFLFDVTENNALYAQKCFDLLYPASTTKLLTAYVTLKYADLSSEVVVPSDAAGITRQGAQLCGLKKGDCVTVLDLLNALLVYSANDAAVLLCDEVRNGMETSEFLNAEAKKIGAVRTTFMNPHGLHDSNHKTNAYDLYLIFKECMKYPEFLDIISKNECQVLCKKKDGTERIISLEATNQYITGEVAAPEGVTVLGGKTGSTSYAGECLVLLSSCNGHMYISGIFGAKSKTAMYEEMNTLLSKELSEN